MTAVICDAFNREKQKVTVPSGMTTGDGRADIVAIRRHLRKQGLNADHLKIAA